MIGLYTPLRTPSLKDSRSLRFRVKPACIDPVKKGSVTHAPQIGEVRQSPTRVGSVRYEPLTQGRLIPRTAT